MSDPVTLADVLDNASNEWWNENVEESEGTFQQAAVLARGGGDPVVIMPDGTLRRLKDILFNGNPRYVLADPVMPDE